MMNEIAAEHRRWSSRERFARWYARQTEESLNHLWERNLQSRFSRHTSWSSFWKIGAKAIYFQFLAEPYTCGSLSIPSLFCSELHFESEKPRDGEFSSCCHKGKIKFSWMQIFFTISTKFNDLFASDYRNFKQNICSYNSAISFASMRAKLVSNVYGCGP